jgi:hypothetical protein
MDNQPPLVADIEELLRRYLQTHPHANDSERGIYEWWLRDAGGGYSMTDVRTAIEHLVAAGDLTKRRLPDGECTYSSPTAPRTRNS